MELFISDLHLDAGRPAPTHAFLEFLGDTAAQARKLYILGDLFESWTGDDELDEFQQQIAAALHQLASRGTRVYFMPGNRDFLIGERFYQASGMQQLPDPSLIYVGGQSVLISHGDIYCTDDEAYQRYRRIVRNPTVRAIYDALPRFIRDRIVASLRSNSQSSIQQKPSDIMDVNAGAVSAALRESTAEVLLHGHTHRPGISELKIEGQACSRIVLGDWYEQGSILRWDTDGPRLENLRFAA